MHARKLRDIQKNQVDAILDLLRKEIARLYPTLTEEESWDWAVDVMNCDSNQEVVETLERVGNIIHDRNQFTCTICGKSTKEVEYDYLVNRDHLECVLKQHPAIVEKQKVETAVDDTCSSLRKAISSLEKRISQLENNR